MRKSEKIEMLERENARLQEQLSFNDLKDRYQNDPAFHKIVDLLYNFLLSNGTIGLNDMYAALRLATDKFITVEMTRGAMSGGLFKIDTNGDYSRA